MAKLVSVRPNKFELEIAAQQENPNAYLAEVLIKRFKKKVNEAGIIQDYRKHLEFLPKSLRRKEKAKQARIKALKRK